MTHIGSLTFILRFLQCFSDDPVLHDTVLQLRREHEHEQQTASSNDEEDLIKGKSQHREDVQAGDTSDHQADRLLATTTPEVPEGESLLSVFSMHVSTQRL